MPRPTFPDHRNLTNLSRDEAELALAALRVLVKHELVKVYTGAGSHDTRWYVWLELSRRRVPLQDWASEWIATWRANPPRPNGDGPDGPDDPEAA